MSLLTVPSLSFADQNTLDSLMNELEARAPRNKVRAEYYDSKYLFKDLGISTPPTFRNFEAVLGWPAKAVDTLSRRVNLDGFVIPDQTSDDLGIDEIWDDNYLDIEAPQAHDSAFIHSCAFIFTTLGDVEAGEPQVLVTVKDARNATGLWDPRKRALKAALSIIERSVDMGEVLAFAMYLPGRVLTCRRIVVGGQWRVTERRHTLPGIGVETLVFQPRLGRRFGSSRISRPVMYLTDAAVRTVVRSEIGAEFYTTPQRWGLNIPQSAFESGGWQAIMGRLLMLDPPDADEAVDPNFKPELGQFPQMTMQPHTEQLRQWAQMFSSETSISVGSLGIVQDNPSSADAIDRADKDLELEAEKADRNFGVGWVRAMRNALMLRDNRSALPAEWKKLRVNWQDPARPSQAARADAMAKQIAVMPWLADSDVALEKLGYDKTEIERIQAHKRRAQASNVVQALLGQADGGVSGGTEVPSEPGQPTS
jgi:hypothetical protein